MTGVHVILIGVLVIVAGLAWLFGPYALIASGVVLCVAGLFVDFDSMKEPQRGKRDSAAP